MRNNLLAKAPLPYHAAAYWQNITAILVNGVGPLPLATQPVRNSNLRLINGRPPMQGGGAGFSVPDWLQQSNEVQQSDAPPN